VRIKCVVDPLFLVTQLLDAKGQYPWASKVHNVHHDTTCQLSPIPVILCIFCWKELIHDINGTHI
jgi:hypothetical protein